MLFIGSRLLKRAWSVILNKHCPFMTSCSKSKCDGDFKETASFQRCEKKRRVPEKENGNVNGWRGEKLCTCHRKTVVVSGSVGS